MPDSSAVECPRCHRVRPWTDGTIAEVWCQVCGHEFPHPDTLADLSEWIGPGKRYATAEDMARDAMRWHDEAQAEKMSRMNGRLSVEQLANRLRSIIGAAEQAMAQRRVPSVVERMAWYRAQAEALLRDILG